MSTFFVQPPSPRYETGNETEFRRGLELYIRTLPTVDSGDYVPVVSSSGGGETLTYTTQLGRWVRTGPLTWFTANIILATKSGGSGDIWVRLPTPSASGRVQILAVQIDNMAAGWTGAPMATIASGAGVVQIREMVAGAAAQAWAKLGATGGLYVTGTYLAA